MPEPESIVQPPESFEEIVSVEFPDGEPEIGSVVVGDDHTALHFLEGVAQAIFMLGAKEDLAEKLEAEVRGLRAVLDNPMNLVAGLVEAHPRNESEDDAAFALRFYAWVRDAGSAAGDAIASWLQSKAIGRVQLWVYASGHGFIPFLIEPKSSESGRPMYGGGYMQFPPDGE